MSSMWKSPAVTRVSLATQQVTKVINIYITLNLISTLVWKASLALLNDAAKCQIHNFGKSLSTLCSKWI